MKGIRDIKGIIPPMITVFKEDGSFDKEGTKHHVNFLLENGVHGIIPGGSTGEFISMTLDERKDLIKTVIEKVNGRVPVYAHTGHYSSDITIKLSKYAQDIGADGVMVITPYYLPRTLDEIYEHYKILAESIDLPIMLYHNPLFSGVFLSDHFIAKLYRDKLITSVKEGSGKLQYIFSLRRKTDKNFKIFYGQDPCALEALVMEADGWVCGVGNTVPRHLVRIWDLLHKENNFEKAKDVWKEAKLFLDLCTDPWPDGSNPPWLPLIKDGLNMQGQKVGDPRRPALPLKLYPKCYREELKKALKGMGLI